MRKTVSRIPCGLMCVYDIYTVIKHKVNVDLVLSFQVAILESQERRVGGT